MFLARLKSLKFQALKHNSLIRFHLTQHDSKLIFRHAKLNRRFDFDFQNCVEKSVLKALLYFQHQAKNAISHLKLKNRERCNLCGKWFLALSCFWVLKVEKCRDFTLKIALEIPILSCYFAQTFNIYAV